MERRATSVTASSQRTARPLAPIGVPADRARSAAAGGGAGDDPAAHVAARGAFAAWLRAGRDRRGVSLDEVARVTKIPRRTLERLEQGRFDELPADVFVRGFIRNYARVVGLDADEAIGRYDGCGVTPGPVAEARARAMLDAVASLAPAAAARAGTGPVALVAAPPTTTTTTLTTTTTTTTTTPDGAAVPEAGTAAAAVKLVARPADRRAKRRGGKRRGKGPRDTARRASPASAPGSAAIDAAEPEAVALEPVASEAVASERAATPAVEAAPELPAAEPIEVTIFADEPDDVVAAAPALARTSRVAPTIAPTITIDDDDPDQAERELEARRDKGEGRRSFLPSSLLDDRAGRQGGLTLAVIILLILATLTLSYLMRRPSSSGEGVTAIDAVIDAPAGSADVATRLA